MITAYDLGSLLESLLPVPYTGIHLSHLNVWSTHNQARREAIKRQQAVHSEWLRDKLDRVKRQQAELKFQKRKFKQSAASALLKDKQNIERDFRAQQLGFQGKIRKAQAEYKPEKSSKNYIPPEHMTQHTHPYAHQMHTRSPYADDDVFDAEFTDAPASRTTPETDPVDKALYSLTQVGPKRKTLKDYDSTRRKLLPSKT